MIEDPILEEIPNPFYSGDFMNTFKRVDRMRLERARAVVEREKALDAKIAAFEELQATLAQIEENPIPSPPSSHDELREVFFWRKPIATALVLRGEVLWVATSKGPLEWEKMAPVTTFVEQLAWNGIKGRLLKTLAHEYTRAAGGNLRLHQLPKRSLCHSF